MKRFISVILALSILFSLGANVGVGYAKMGENSTNNNTFRPTDDPIFWYEQPVDENGNLDYRAYPIYGDPQDIPDEEFFGQWDPYENIWISIPYFKYAEYPEMAKVEAAAKAGNYAEAKNELWEYYKIYGTQRVPQVTSDPKVNKLLDAQVRNVYPTFSNGRQEEFVGIEYGDDWQKYEIDVYGSMSSAKNSANANYVVQLASVDKYFTQIEIYSKDADIVEYRPYLELTVNGNTRRIEAMADATIVSADEADNNYGSEEVLVIEEHGTYQSYDGDNKSKRAFVAFDISGLKEDDILSKAKLNVYARATCPKDPTREITGVKELSTFYMPEYKWTEDTITWNFFTDFLWFSCNDVENWDYITPSEANLKGKVMDHHRSNTYGRFAQAAEFYDSEDYAYNAIRHEMALINSIGLEPDVMNALDRSTHCIGATLYQIYLIDSKYMTGDIFTAMLKFNWQLADYQVNYYFGGLSTNNWATYATSAVYHLCARYPEFRTFDEWMEAVKIENERCFGSNNFEDGMCSESSLSYTSTLLNTFDAPVRTSFVTGVEAPFTESMIESIYGIVMTLAYARGPYGGGFNIADTHDPYSDYTGTIKQWYTYLFEGDEAMEYFATGGISGKAPEHPTTIYPVALRTYFRSDWGKNSLQMSFINSKQPNLTHGHDDVLSVAMFAYGKYLLTDQAYSQNLTDTQFKYYMYSPVQHNVVTVNDVSDYLKDGVHSYGTIEEGYGVEHAHEFNDLYDFTEYGTELYTTSEYIQRSVTFMRNQNFWIISDYAIPNDTSEGVENLFAQHWHVYPGANMTDDSETLQVRSNFTDVNVMIVPIEYEEIDELQYVDTKYSEHSAVVTDSKKAMYTKTKEGAGRFTTIIIPINSGEDFEVDTSVVDTGIDNPDLVNATYFRITNKNTGDVNYYYYYHINDINEKPEDGAKIGEFTTDATTMVVQKNASGTIVSTFLMDATYLKTTELSTEYLFKSETPVSGIAYNRNAQFVDIKASSVTEEQLKGITIYQSGVKSATLNDTPIEGKLSGGYVYFNNTDTPPVEGNPDEAGNVDSTNSNNSNNTNTGNRPTGGGVGASGGGGGAAAPKPVEKDPTEGTEQKPEDNPVVDIPPIDDAPAIPSNISNELENHWGEDAITSLYKGGVITGDDSGLRLKDSISRAEFVTLMVRALNLQTTEYGNSFKDVDADNWYADYIATAYENGLVNGADGMFRPNDTITREEICKIIASAIDAETQSEALDFTDTDEISTWAMESVKKAYSLGIINGMDNGSFAPKSNALREQAFVMLSRLLAVIK